MLARTIFDQSANSLGMSDLTLVCVAIDPQSNGVFFQSLITDKHLSQLGRRVKAKGLQISRKNGVIISYSDESEFVNVHKIYGNNVHHLGSLQVGSPGHANLSPTGDYVITRKNHIIKLFDKQQFKPIDIVYTTLLSPRWYNDTTILGDYSPIEDLNFVNFSMLNVLENKIKRYQLNVTKFRNFHYLNIQAANDVLCISLMSVDLTENHIFTLKLPELNALTGSIYKDIKPTIIAKRDFHCLSPNGKAVVCVKDSMLSLLNLETNEECVSHVPATRIKHVSFVEDGLILINSNKPKQNTQIIAYTAGTEANDNMLQAMATDACTNLASRAALIDYVKEANAE